MQDFYLIAEDEQALMDVLPPWLTDGVDVLPSAETHALFWGVPVVGSRDFHVVLRLLDESRSEEICEVLGDFMIPRTSQPWQECE